MSTISPAFDFGMETHRPAFASSPTPMISYGLRFPEAALAHCERDRCSSRIYIICSKSLAKKTDALLRLTAELGDRVVGTRIGIDPHTPLNQVAETIENAQKLDVDCIITLGAGSITDAAKIVRLGLANSALTVDDLDTLWGTSESNPRLRKDLIKPSIPLIHIPTSLSGGEYQAIAGGTDTGRYAKRTFFCGGVNPELVIQDPELCITTPSWVWLSTGIRSVDHCVETLCSLLSNEQGDERSRTALPKLVTGLLQCVNDPYSVDSHHLCQQGVVDAMAAVSSGVPLGASHAIGHQLGPLGVGHGETSCILLPAVCKYNYAQKANVQRQDAVRDLLLRESKVQDLLQKNGLRADKVDLGDILGTVISALALPRYLEDVGVSQDKFDVLAKNSLDDIWIRTNAVCITEESQVKEILFMCTRGAQQSS
ncbi:alcohol dehydrogenase [Fusarium sporotrichioides]|uniref:Alcohol dehydrogenase n=1 Tax=Fusarium sporotrichioides TaxID=5514 RepID=A0A395RL70_FUSSP|nr:alcohol dehydrogenase [Fusarium sporotrichioides]